MTMGRIYSNVKPKFKNVKKELVKEKINEYFDEKNKELESKGKKPRLAVQEKLKREMTEFVFEIINEQLEYSFTLDLNDRLVADKINVSERRAKQIRLELKNAGLIWFPEWSRPKAKGHYPKWMLAKEFIEFEKFDKEKQVSKAKNKKYKSLYYSYYEDAKKEAYNELIDRDLYVDIRSFMVRVHELVSENLALDNLDKEMLLK